LPKIPGAVGVSIRNSSLVLLNRKGANIKGPKRIRVLLGKKKKHIVHAWAFLS
jgi:hypothetical protein